MPTRIEILKPDGQNPHPDIVALASAYISRTSIGLKLRYGGRIEHHRFYVSGMSYESVLVLKPEWHELKLIPSNRKAAEFVGGLSEIEARYNVKTKTGEIIVP